VALRPNAGHGLLILDVSRSHTTTHLTVGRTPLDVWSARRRDLYLTTHNTHNRQTSMPPVGFEPTISGRAATDLRLRPRGHWDRAIEIYIRPYVKYDCHWPYFYENQAYSTAFCKDCLYQISWNSDKGLSRRYKVTYRPARTDGHGVYLRLSFRIEKYKTSQF